MFKILFNLFKNAIIFFKNNQQNKVIMRAPDLHIYSIQKISLISIMLRVTGFFIIFLYLFYIIGFLNITNILDIFIYLFKTLLKKIVHSYEYAFFNIIEQTKNLIEKNQIPKDLDKKFLFKFEKNELIIIPINQKKDWYNIFLYFTERSLNGYDFIPLNFYNKKDIKILIKPINPVTGEILQDFYIINNKYALNPLLSNIVVCDILSIFDKEQSKTFSPETIKLMDLSLHIIHSFNNLSDSDEYIKDLFQNYLITFLILFIIMFCLSHILIGYHKTKKIYVEENIKIVYNFENNTKMFVLKESLKIFFTRCFTFLDYDFSIPIKKIWRNTKYYIIHYYGKYYYIRMALPLYFAETLLHFFEVYLLPTKYLNLKNLSGIFFSYLIMYTYPFFVILCSDAFLFTRSPSINEFDILNFELLNEISKTKIEILKTNEEEDFIINTLFYSQQYSSKYYTTDMIKKKTYNFDNIDKFFIETVPTLKSLSLFDVMFDFQQCFYNDPLKRIMFGNLTIIELHNINKIINDSNDILINFYNEYSIKENNLYSSKLLLNNIYNIFLERELKDLIQFSKMLHSLGKISEYNEMINPLKRFKFLAYGCFDIFSTNSLIKRGVYIDLVFSKDHPFYVNVEYKPYSTKYLFYNSQLQSRVVDRKVAKLFLKNHGIQVN